MFKKRKAFVFPENADAEELVLLSRTQSDPVQKHALLLRAAELNPDHLPALRELLLLGNLHKRNPAAPDYNIIKCYLLHVFEHPEKHTEEEIRTKAQEIFHHPLLQRCISLSSTPDQFITDYLMELSKEYVRLFIQGDSSHLPSLLGFTRHSHVGRYLAKPMGDCILNMLSCPFLSADEQQKLAQAFYLACNRALDSDTADLNRQIGTDALRITLGSYQ